MKKKYSPIFSIMFWAVMAVFIAVTALNLFSVPKSRNENLCQTDMEWFSSKDLPVDIYDSSQVSRITEDKTYSVYFTADKSAENTVLAITRDIGDLKKYLDEQTPV